MAFIYLRGGGWLSPLFAHHILPTLNNITVVKGKVNPQIRNTYISSEL